MPGIATNGVCPIASSIEPRRRGVEVSAVAVGAAARASLVTSSPAWTFRPANDRDENEETILVQTIQALLDRSFLARGEQNRRF
jgi:hypothetical protein